jgi:hypothetical protein
MTNRRALAVALLTVLGVSAAVNLPLLAANLLFGPGVTLGGLLGGFVSGFVAALTATWRVRRLGLPPLTEVRERLVVGIAACLGVCGGMAHFFLAMLWHRPAR